MLDLLNKYFAVKIFIALSQTSISVLGIVMKVKYLNSLNLVALFSAPIVTISTVTCFLSGFFPSGDIIFCVYVCIVYI